MNAKPFSAEEQAQLDRLSALPDSEIDFSDIPEMTDEQWVSSVRYADFQLARRLDKEVIGWFRGREVDAAEAINRVLREHMKAAQAG